MSTIFEKIIASEIPATFVWKDEICVAFMDIDPQTEGHCLVVPRKPIDHFFDVPAKDFAHLMNVAQMIAKTAVNVFDCNRVCTFTVGYEVPHTHVHLVPTNSEDDIRPGHKLNATPAEVKQAGQRLQAALIEAGYEQAQF